jgi:Homeodomain-like domain
MAALAVKAAGVGYRKIAARLGRPPSTVRRWLYRFASRAEMVRSWFTAVAVSLSVDSLLPGPQASVFADAVAAIGAAASAAAHRFGLLIVSGWRLASTVSSGRLLAPTWAHDQSTPVDAWADLLR